MKRHVLFTVVMLAAASILTSGCVISTDPCKNVDCDGYGVCIEVGGDAQCDCNDNYRPEGLHCIWDPCYGEDCGPHGECIEENSQAVCDCDDNYIAEGMNCVFAGYTVTFTWVFGPEEKNCSQVLVGAVRVELYQNDELLTEETLDCTDGGVDIEGMYDGTYIILLTGISNSGKEWFRQAFEVTVAGQDLDLGPIILDPRGDMVFSWSFGTDKWDCITAGVSRVDITVKDLDGNILFEPAELPYCEDGDDFSGNTIVLEDWDLGTYNLILEGLCEHDPRVVGYLLDAEIEVVEKGENNYGNIDLDDNGGCL